jgi:hypothetical protein
VPLESRHRKLSKNTKFVQILHREHGQPKAEKMTKISQSAEKLTTTIWRTTFAHRVFPILTMSFQKDITFLKRETSSTTGFFWFVKNLSELTGIRVEKLGKTILNAENSPIALLPGATVFCIEVRIVQGQFRWKVDSAGFPYASVLTRSEHRKTLNCQSKKGWSKGQKLVKISSKSDKTCGASNQRSTRSSKLRGVRWSYSTQHHAA